MIVSASYKTDIPAFYGAWFVRRLEAGCVRIENAFGGPPATVSLAPEAVSGFVFWTRNAGPFLPALARVRELGVPFVVQYTITGYPRALDAATIAPDRALAQVLALARAYGPRSVVWRYDPVVVSSLTPPAWHAETVSRFARALAGAVDEVVLSVAHVYRKTRRNLDQAARARGFTWRDPDAAEKRELLLRLAAIVRAHGLAPTLCGQPELLVPGLGEARCIDAERLADVAGHPIAADRRPHRPSCGCWASRDIGAYDTCPHGCAYCYAVASPAAAKRRLRAHDAAAPFLAPPRGGAG